MRKAIITLLVVLAALACLWMCSGKAEEAVQKPKFEYIITNVDSEILFSNFGNCNNENEALAIATNDIVNLTEAGKMNHNSTINLWIKMDGKVWHRVVKTPKREYSGGYGGNVVLGVGVADSDKINIKIDNDNSSASNSSAKSSSESTSNTTNTNSNVNSNKLNNTNSNQNSTNNLPKNNCKVKKDDCKSKNNYPHRGNDKNCKSHNVNKHGKD